MLTIHNHHAACGIPPAFYVTAGSALYRMAFTTKGLGF